MRIPRRRDRADHLESRLVRPLAERRAFDARQQVDGTLSGCGLSDDKLVQHAPARAARSRPCRLCPPLQDGDAGPADARDRLEALAVRADRADELQ